MVVYFGESKLHGPSVEVSWANAFSDVSVSVDGRLVATFPKLGALKDKPSITLQDGRQLALSYSGMRGVSAELGGAALTRLGVFDFPGSPESTVRSGGTALKVLAGIMGLIRFGGHSPKGG